MKNNLTHSNYENTKYNDVNIKLNSNYYFNVDDVTHNTKDYLILASSLALPIIAGGAAGSIIGYIFGNNIPYNIFKFSGAVAVAECHIITCANITEAYFEENEINESFISRAFHSAIDDYKDVIDSLHFSIDYIGSYIKESIF